MDPPDPPPAGLQPGQPEPEPPTDSSPATSIWFWLTFLLSPLAALIYAIIKDERPGRELKEREARLRRQHPDLKEVREAAINETLCRGCGALINPVTGDGFYAPPGEPWAMVCDQCGHRVEPDT